MATWVNVAKTPALSPQLFISGVSFKKINEAGVSAVGKQPAPTDVRLGTPYGYFGHIVGTMTTSSGKAEHWS